MLSCSKTPLAPATVMPSTSLCPYQIEPHTPLSAAGAPASGTKFMRPSPLRSPAAFWRLETRALSVPAKERESVSAVLASDSSAAGSDAMRKRSVNVTVPSSHSVT